MLVVDERGRVLSDAERIDALRAAGLEISLDREPHAWREASNSPAGAECEIRGRSEEVVNQQQEVRENLKYKETMSMTDEQRLGIYGIRNYEHRGEMKSSWTQIGVAFRNEDESLTLRFDYIPAGGDVRINVRPIRKPEEAGEAETQV